ncbi:MAG: glutathione S-transferase family protein [Pseudomonadota bacterium]
MIDLYTASTPNGWKASICLEELELEYETTHLDFAKNEQKQDWYLQINPNGRIPAIIDRGNSDFGVFESGAILIYLAEKAGKLLSTNKEKRSIILQWLMFQMGGIGPMQGQALVFIRNVPEKMLYVIDRYLNETKRLYGVLDRRLEAEEFLASEYSIADIALWPWIYCAEWTGIDLQDTPNLSRWFDTLSSRPAIQQGLNVPEPFDIKALMENGDEVKETEQRWRNLLSENNTHTP